VSQWDQGDAVPLVYTLPDTATVVLTVTAPDGTESTPTLTTSGAAPTVTYAGAVLADEPGLWRWRFLATGNITDAEAGHFSVRPTLSGNVYTSLPELKSSLSIPVADTVDDDDLLDAILTASRAVSADCRRHFHKITEARSIIPDRDVYTLRLGDFMDLVSVTSLKTSTEGDGTWETTWAASDYVLLTEDGTPNINAGVEARPYQIVRAVGDQIFPRVPSYGRSDLIEITGVWGWPAVPDQIRRATRMMAAEVFRLKDAPLGAAGVGDLGIIRVRENPRYKALIRHYQRGSAVVPVA
jgi:hypothetical protein